MGVKHKFTSLISDSGTPGLVKPSNWNEGHISDLAAGTVTFSTSAGGELTGDVNNFKWIDSTKTLILRNGSVPNSSFSLAISGGISIQDGYLRIFRNESPTFGSFLSYSNTNTYGAALYLERYRGTSTSTSAVQVNDNLGKIQWYGALAPGNIDLSSEINSITVAVSANTSVASVLTFSTRSSNDYSFNERMRIGTIGNILIGKTADLGGIYKLQVEGYQRLTYVSGGSAFTDIYSGAQGAIYFSGGTGAHYIRSTENLYLDIDSDNNGSNFFLFRGNSATVNIMTLKDTGEVIINNTATMGTDKFQVLGTGKFVDESASEYIQTFEEYSNTTSGSNLKLLKGRGTFAVPAAVNSADSLGSIDAWGYLNGTISSKVGKISFLATTTYTSASAPTAITFSTTTTGTSAAVEKMRLMNTGDLSIGSTGPVFGTPNGPHLYIGGQSLVIGTSYTPATSAASGLTGEMCWDANYVYVCVATNQWKRSPLSGW